jgi:hypothetical protein
MEREGSLETSITFWHFTSRWAMGGVQSGGVRKREKREEERGIQEGEGGGRREGKEGILCIYLRPLPTSLAMSSRCSQDRTKECSRMRSPRDPPSSNSKRRHWGLLHIAEER